VVKQSEYTVTKFKQNTVLWETSVCGIHMNSERVQPKAHVGVRVCPLKEFKSVKRDRPKHNNRSTILANRVCALTFYKAVLMRFQLCYATFEQVQTLGKPDVL